MASLRPSWPGRPPRSGAGASARQRYRNLRAAGRARRRVLVALALAAGAAAGLLLGGSVGLLVGALWGAGGATLWLRRNDTARSWARGALGERRTARLLRPLERAGFAVLHDRALPRGRANLDHLVITPAGTVVLVDSKNWARGRRLRRTGRTVKPARYEASRVREELARALGGPVEVRAVLAVHGGDLPLLRRVAVNGVPLLRARQVRRWIVRQCPAADPARAERVRRACERLFPPYQEPPRAA
ncbi:NERD domain-containing protein [Actinomadura kijaniata]|uniref:nuclease-related domain-containing protein n=1 Tax=Actinomadura kijaniata TaxID=46161 RepID=UPI003F1CF9F9